jgi:hypothetical protein
MKDGKKEIKNSLVTLRSMSWTFQGGMLSDGGVE